MLDTNTSLTSSDMPLRSRILLMLALAVFGIGLYELWAADWLSFAQLKAHHGALAAWVGERPLTAYAGFFFAFVLGTAFSVPVATLLTLIVGSVFGFAEALLLVSLASSGGATLAMLLSRHVFRSLVERRWPDLVARINSGLAKDGDFYLLALRLAPAPPYFLVNLLMGLTRLPAYRFFVVSLLGMLPLDILFVQAGSTLATLQSPADILDVRTLAVLALAGMLPLLLRWMLRTRITVDAR